jgi:hypothetical protein
MRTVTPAGVAPRFWRRPRAVILAAAPAVMLAAGVTVVACGGGGGSSSASGSTSTTGSASVGATASATVSATQWASRVCLRIASWVNDLQTGNNSLEASVKSSTSLEQVKTEVVNFLGGAVVSTNTMIHGIQRAGSPAVANGEAASRDLVTGLQAVQAAFVQAQTQAQQLPADNPAVFNSQTQALSNSLQTGLQQAKTNLNGLSQKSAELNAAFSNQAACQSLNK